MKGNMINLGENSYKLIATQEYTASATSTSSSSVGTITLGSNYFTSDKIIYVKIRDKAGSRNGYFVGTDTYFFNFYAANNSTTILESKATFVHRKSSAGSFNTYVPVSSNEGYGIYPASLNSSGVLTIKKRYNSTYTLTVNGTYVVEVYTLNYSKNGNPFNYSY